jgi:hypothetical protein
MLTIFPALLLTIKARDQLQFLWMLKEQAFGASNSDATKERKLRSKRSDYP